MIQLAQNPSNFSISYDWSHVSTGNSQPGLSFDTAMPIFPSTEYNQFLLLLLQTYRGTETKNIGTAVYQFQVHQPPLTDSLEITVSSASGEALTDMFNISCSGNISEMSSTSLVYSIGYITTDVTPDALDLIPTRGRESLCSWITFKSKYYYSIH